MYLKSYGNSNKLIYKSKILKIPVFKDRIDYILSSLAIWTKRNQRTIYPRTYKPQQQILIFQSFLLIFIGVYLLYNIVLASIIQQSISAMHIHISPLFGFPSICSPQHNEFPVLYNWFSLVILCVCVCVRAHTHKHMHTRTQSCRLCNLIVCGLPGSSVHGNSQASILEWIAISSSRGVFLTQGSNLFILHCRQILYY